MLSAYSLSKYQAALALEPATEAFILRDCVPQVAQRSVVSESSWPPPETEPAVPPRPPVSHQFSGVGKKDLLIVMMSPAAKGALQAVATVTVGETQVVTPVTG